MGEQGKGVPARDYITFWAGQCAGKGAIVTASTEQALAAIEELSAPGESARRLTIWRAPMSRAGGRPHHSSVGVLQVPAGAVDEETQPS